MCGVGDGGQSNKYHMHDNDDRPVEIDIVEVVVCFHYWRLIKIHTHK